MLTSAAALALALSAGAALAQPDADESRWGMWLGRSPVNLAVEAGFEYHYGGRLIDAGGFDEVGFPAALVELRIVAPCQNPVVLNPDADSDAFGRVFWGQAALNQGGGACGQNISVEIWVDWAGDGFDEADGDLFAIRDQVTSPDENGDGVVALNDFVVWRTAFNAGGPLYQGDLSRDGIITIADLLMFIKHFVAGAAGRGVDEAELMRLLEIPGLDESSWGAIKSKYR
jgi:hypothetical protein